MTSEAELLAKLEAWVAAHAKPPTIFDAIATRDGELFAAYILKAFRVAAREAVIERLSLEAATTFAAEAGAAANPLIRVFDGLAGAWRLEATEILAVLGLDDAAELKQLRATVIEQVGIEIIERVVILLDIFKAINTLLPEADRADAWIRATNAAPIFNGRSALDVMTHEGLAGLRGVRAYIQAQVWST